MTLDPIEARLRGLVAEQERCLVVLAGSNGAGKSTFYDIYPSTSPLDQPFRAVARWEGGRCVWRSGLQPTWLPSELR